MAGVNSGQLDRAVEEWREAQGPQQAALPGVGERITGDAQLPERRGPGRPPGASNLRTEQLARLYRGRYGDPLAIATEIGAKNVLDPDTVGELARIWGCSRFEAVKLWAQVNADANRYHHQQMPRAVLVPPGAPGGERVLVEVDGVYQVVAAEGEEPEDAAEAA